MLSSYLLQVPCSRLQVHLASLKQFTMPSATDPRYGNMTVYTDGAHYLFLSESHFVDKKQLDEQVERLQTRRGLSHPNLQPLYCFSFDSRSGLCSSMHKVQVCGLYIADTLHKTIMMNKKDEVYMEQQKALSVMTQLLSVASYLHQRRLSLENISAECISLDQSGQAMMIDSALLHKTKPQHKRNPGEQQAVAPEVLSDQSGLNPFQADVFALGLVFLFMLTNQDPVKHYHWPSSTIQWPHLQLQIGSVDLAYPTLLRQIIQAMLLPSPKERPSMATLYRQIQSTHQQQQQQMVLPQQQQQMVLPQQQQIVHPQQPIHHQLPMYAPPSQQSFMYSQAGHGVSHMHSASISVVMPRQQSCSMLEGAQ